MSSMRSASSRTWTEQEELRDRLRRQKHTPTRAAHQVSDGAEVDELVHLQVVEPARGRDHNVHAALDMLDLAPAVPSPVDADTEKRRRRTQSEVGSQFSEVSLLHATGPDLV